MNIHESRLDILQDEIEQIAQRPAGQGGISPIEFSPLTFSGTNADRPMQYLKKLNQFLTHTPIAQSQRCIVVSNSLKGFAAE